jgi:acyl carrier protein
LGILVTNGIDINLLNLYEQRHCQHLDISKLGETSHPKNLPANTWLVTGGSVRYGDQAVGTTGKISPLNLDTVQELAKISVNKTDNTKNTTVTNMTSHHQTNGHSHVANGNSTSSVVHNQAQLSKMSQIQSVQPTPGSQEAALLAYQAYQHTMREFLQLQEEVMKQFLSSVTSGQLVNGNARPFVSTTPAISPRVAPAVPSIQEYPAPINSIPTVSSVPANNTVVPEPVTSIAPGEVAAINQVAPVQKPVETTPEKQSNTLNREQLTKILVDLVSDRTGYPQEMLGLDQDMEAELGIDSIKRVEILGSLLNNLPASLAPTLQSQMETLTQSKSLGAVIEIILNLIGNSAATTTESSYQSQQEINGLGKQPAR